jgi:uncharacterized protein (DUF2235 family)
MKRLIFCFDGTWNNLDSGHVTNVGTTAQSIAPQSKDEMAQIVYYDEGVGNARRNANFIVKNIEKFSGGLLGHGLLANLAEAYKFLIFNYQPGDQIFVFGFSRGAFSARSFTGLLHACGVLRRSHVERITEAIDNYRKLNPSILSDALKLRTFRWNYGKNSCVDPEEDAWRCEAFPDDYSAGESPLLQIEYLGVWDTVGSLGIPSHWDLSKLVNHKYRFHDCRLSTFIKYARHAVAIDERRKNFAPTIWDNLDEVNKQAGFCSTDPDAPYQEVWFPGTHGSVGGGGSIRGLSDEALNWILRGAKDHGITLDTEDASEIFRIKPNFRAQLDNVDPEKKPTIMGRAMALLPKSDRLPGPKGLHQVSISARYRWAAKAKYLPEKVQYRPNTLNSVAGLLDDWAAQELGNVETKAITSAPELKSESVVDEEYHVVVRGDTLSKIACDHYGDTVYYRPLFRINRPLLSNPDEISTGQEIWLAPKAMLDKIIANNSINETKS